MTREPYIGYMFYKHTQVGYLILFLFFAIALLFVLVFIQIGFDYISLAVMIFTLSILASFASLTVIIDEDYLRIKFGYGIFKKSFDLKEVESIKTVKNRWYYGWGIRGWLWPPMWIYNISGFDAVELKMKNGKIYRIGTDEPKILEHKLKISTKRITKAQLSKDERFG